MFQRSSCGVLKSKKDAVLAVSCETFDYQNETTDNDRITIEWINVSKNSSKEFRKSWFQADGMIRRKNLSIEYNL